MARYIGYSTVGAYKKVTLMDRQLVIQDLVNAFNIKEGEMPGRPRVGCAIWNYLFEPQTETAIESIKTIAENTCNQDPRVVPRSIEVFSQENGILIEIEVTINMDVDPVKLNLYFDNQDRRAILL